MDEGLRRRLFSVAYGILGSAADAEDIVQEAFLRYERADRTDVRSPEAYLRTVVTRLAFDQLKSARRRREEYFGPWLPTPVATERLQPEEQLEQRESLSMALMVMLERLSPLERVAYVLHDIFDYGYADIAEILERSESTCRKLRSRAAARLRSERRYQVSTDDHRRVLGAFLNAVEHAEIEPLLELLADDAVLVSDGGGRVQALAWPMEGAERIAAFVMRLQGRSGGAYELRWGSYNHEPALLLYSGASSGDEPAQLLQVVLFHVEDSRITDIWIVRNPEKLARC